MRVFWLCLGVTSLALGLIGLALPLLPTVPFLLLAGFSFARSSHRLHDWLITHPRLGPPIRDWQRDGAISRRAKSLGTVSIVVSPGLSVLLNVPQIIILIQCVTLGFVLIFIWTRPEGSR